MGRNPRPVADGATYHVMARGNRKQPIFLDDDDRRTFLRMLSRVCIRYGWVCYGYCLMGNHFHLAIKTPVGNLSQGMCHLVGRYAWLHNQSHGIADHLFRERYLAVVIESDEQLIAVVRYIARNPLRGGLVETAEQWPWGSYPALLGKAKPLDGFDPAETLALFSERRWLARIAVRGLVEDGDPRRDRWPAVSLAAA
jgi:putative transposase